MSKIVLTPVTGADNLSTLNENFGKIADNLNNKVLYRNNPQGEPNQLQNDVDMNGYRIYNLPKPVYPSEPVRLSDITGGLGGGGGGNVSPNNLLVYPTYSAAIVNILEMDESQIIEITSDETKTGRRTRYIKNISNLVFDSFILPYASPSQAGAVKVGAGLSIDGNGVLTSSGGGGGAQIKIVVMGDSLTAQQALLDDAWPTLLENTLNSSGASVSVKNIALNGWSHFKANTIPAFGTSTMVEKAIELSPNILIVALGHNDSTIDVDSRSLAQTQTDAATLYQDLRNALPGTTIVYASELAYDADNGSPSSLLNRQVIPYLMNKRVSGILSGVWCEEILVEPVSPLTRTRYANWLSLDNYIKGLPTVDSSFTLDIWKASRIGLTGTDGMHLTAEGERYLSANARKAFLTNPVLSSALPNLSDQNYVWFMDADNLFDALLFNVGGYFGTKPWNMSSEHVVEHFGPFRAFNPDTWYLPSKGTFSSTPTNYVQGTHFAWGFRGVAHNTLVQTSIDGGAWVDQNFTNSRGDYTVSAVLDDVLFPVGSYVIRYKVGVEVHGPLLLNVTAGVVPSIPAATATKRGGIKVGAGLTITGDVLSTSSMAASLRVTPFVSADADGVFMWEIVGCPASTTVFLSVNGATATSTGVVTDVNGAASSIMGGLKLVSIGFPVGTYSLVYSCGGVFFPATILTVEAGSGGGSYTLPAATTSIRGGIKVGSNLNITGDTLSVPMATSSVPGVALLGASGIVEGAWQTLSLASGGSYLGRTPRFRLVGTRVDLAGIWNGGSGHGSSLNDFNIATLPIGYRPTGLVGMSAAAGGVKTGAITVGDSGSLSVSISAIAGDAILFLDGCSFYTT